MKQKIIFLLLIIVMLINDCNSSASLDDGSGPAPVKHLVAIGGAFTDIIVPSGHALYDALLTSPRFLTKEPFLEYNALLDHLPLIPGGSAANATAIFAQLGGHASFGSTIGSDKTGGRDKAGEIWRSSLNNLGVNTKLHICDSEPTGGCLVCVHPDGQRSMRTYLGTENVAGNDFTSVPFNASSIVFVEGYGLNSEAKAPVYLKALERAKAKGSYIVVSASDPACVESQREVFISLIRTTADLIIMNADEARELVSDEGTKGDVQACVKFIQTTGKHAVITLGASGAIAVDGEDIWHCSARDVAVVDTLGAGDAFAGGFLYGLSVDCKIDECLQLGSYMAGEVVSCCGARLSGDLSSIVSSGTYKDISARQISLKELAVGVVDPVIGAEE